MKLLSALDALFLHLETAEQPMHVGALHLLELPGGYQGDYFDDLRRHWQGRLHLAPVFHRRLVTMPLALSNPAWVLETDVDLDWHLQRVRLQRPGNTRQLDAFVAQVHAELLPRDRPLWRAWLIEGLPGGQKAFYAKFHHAALDGQGGVALAKALLDLSPKPPARAARAAGATLAGPPDPDQASATSLLGASLRGLLGQYGALLRATPQMGASLGQLIGTRLRAASSDQATGAAGGYKTGPGSIIASWPDRLLDGVRGLLAPRTRLNVAIDAPRSFATLRLPMAQARQIGRDAGGSLNDVVLAVISGGLRRYLLTHHDLPDRPLVCAMPVSLRSAPHEDARQIGNQTSMVLTPLATDVDDPLEQLAAIIRGTHKAKQVSGAMKSGMPTDLPSLGLPWLLTGLTRLYTRSRLADRIPPVANVIISNVPGPAMPLYLAGARVTACHPVSIVVHGIALNITLESYDGHLDFGLIACARAVPDVAVLARFLEQAFEELTVHWAANTGHTAPVPAAKPQQVAVQNAQKVHAPRTPKARTQRRPGTA